jgi:hypothetical protein
MSAITEDRFAIFRTNTSIGNAKGVPNAQFSKYDILSERSERSEWSEDCFVRDMAFSYPSIRPCLRPSARISPQLLYRFRCAWAHLKEKNIFQMHLLLFIEKNLGV